MSASRRARSGGGVSFLAPPPASFHRGDVLLLAGIVLVALGLRLGYLNQMRASPLFDQPIMDEKYHDEWALAFAEGRTYFEGPYFRAPLYPWILGTIYWIFGHDFLIPRIVQAALGSLSCGLLYLIGRQVFSRAVGAIAGFAAATYWVLIYFDGELLIPPLIVFLDLVLLGVLLAAAKRPSGWCYGLAGLILGVSALARPNILLFAPAVVIWILWQHRREWRRASIFAIAFTVGCAAPILPVTARNHVAGRDFVLISSQGGVNFFIGNNARSDGRTAIVPGTPGGWWEGYHASIARAEAAEGRKLRPSEVSRYYFREAMKWIGAKPGEFLAHTWFKTRLFFSAWEISNDKGIYFWTQMFVPMTRYLPLGFGVVGTLGLAGTVWSMRKGSATFPLWGFIVIYAASMIVFFATSRYRVPLLAPLMLLGAHFVVDVARSWWAGHRRVALVAAAVLVPAALLVNIAPGGAKMFRNDSLDHVRLGNIYLREDKPGAAEAEYRAALTEVPTLLVAHFQLGFALERQGRSEEAVGAYRAALACKPKLSIETPQLVARTHYNLARVLTSQGRSDAARPHLEVAFKLEPKLGR